MTLPEEQRKQIEQEAEIEFPKNSDNDAFMGRELKMANQRGYIVAAVKYHLVFQQKDEEIARLTAALNHLKDVFAQRCAGDMIPMTEKQQTWVYDLILSYLKPPTTEALKPILP